MKTGVVRRPKRTKHPEKRTCRPLNVPLFQSRPLRQRSSAVEQGTHKPLVGGSIPPAGTTFRFAPQF